MRCYCSVLMLFLSAMIRLNAFVILFVSLLVASCANIVPPEGGEKDTTPPKLLAVEPKDSLLNKRVTEISMRFDEFLVLKDASKEVQVSPVLPFPISTVVLGKKVKVTIPDSLLKDNTTYRVSFGKAITDLHEGNAFEGYTYTFSTGSYFDSLQMSGMVVDAATGNTVDDVDVLLHYAEDSDSSIVRKKPAYIVRTTAGGLFTLAGLPAKEFRIYALQDKNGNLVYDGGDEKVAFIDSVFTPLPPNDKQPLKLLLFKEKPVIVDTATTVATGRAGAARGKRKGDDVLTYKVEVDTSNKDIRTHDIKLPITVVLSQDSFVYDRERMFLSFDSAGADVEVPIVVSIDTLNEQQLNVYASWKKNELYTLRLLPGWATDTAGNKLPPSKYLFRTMNDDDYGKLQVRTSSKYLDDKYVLLVKGATDTVYSKPITDTIANLSLLDPGNYKIYIIVDENRNGVWDPGVLLEKIQPEVVIPHNNEVMLKAGWENVEDFTPVGERKASEGDKGDTTSPDKRDADTDK